MVAATVTLEIPRCAVCERRSKRRARRVLRGSLAAALLVGGGILLALRLSSEMFWWLFGAYSVVALALAAYIASTLASPVKIKSGDQSRGILKLRFRNPEYSVLLTKHMAGSD